MGQRPVLPRGWAGSGVSTSPPNTHPGAYVDEGAEASGPDIPHVGSTTRTPMAYHGYYLLEGDTAGKGDVRVPSLQAGVETRLARYPNLENRFCSLTDSDPPPYDRFCEYRLVNGDQLIDHHARPCTEQHIPARAFHPPAQLRPCSNFLQPPAGKRDSRRCRCRHQKRSMRRQTTRSAMPA